MTIYHYDNNKMFIGESEANVSPLDAKPMIPKNATAIVPPAKEDGCALMFLNGEWVNRVLPIVKQQSMPGVMP